MKKKHVTKIMLYLSLIIVITVAAFLISSAIQTSPDYEYLTLLDGIRRCVWYGFEGYTFVGEQEKAEIILPESLMELTPLFRWVELNESDSYSDSCSLIYNPNGYKNNTWIAIYITKGAERKLFGDYVLLYDKEIKRERNILEDTSKTNDLKYYTVRRLPNVAD